MSGIFDRLTRNLLGRSAPDATGTVPGSGSEVEAGPGAGPHDPSPVPEYSPDRDASEDRLGFGDGTPGRVPSEYRRGDESGSPERDISEYRRGDESGSPERDTSEYRDGNALPPRQEGGLAYQSDDVVAQQPPESAPIQARMTDTVAGSEADGGIPVDEAGESLADADPPGPSLGTPDMPGLSADEAHADTVPTENFSLRYSDPEMEYEPGPGGKTMGSGPGAYEVEEQGEGSRDADEPASAAPPEGEVESGGLVYRSDDTVADSPERRPLQARMSDTVAEDEDTKESTDDADSSDKGSGEPPAVAGPTGPLNASETSSLDGGGAVEDDEAPLTLMDFKVSEDELPAVIEDTSADLGTEALPDLGELGVDEDDAPPVE